MSVKLENIQAAQRRLKHDIATTPCEQSITLSAQLGFELYIKFENQQFTASFKERGALNCLLELGDKARRGVIAMSAGNHAQAIAYHGQRLGIPTTIVMPRTTPNAKVEATRVFNAQIILHGDQFDETLAFTLAAARDRDLCLVHPFDDPHVVAGQGTVALEILDQVKDLDVIVVPVGGGGLIGGVATVIKTLQPQIKIIGVQMERFAGAHAAFYDKDLARNLHISTVAEGIAVKSPGKQTMGLIRQYVDEVHLVSETQVEQAIFDLLEIEKTVAEGAGAAPLAWLRKIAQKSSDFQNKKVCMILSGGNIDMMIMSSVLQRGLVRSHRLVRLQVEIPDTPGALADLTAIVGGLDSNIMDIQHQRAFGASSVRATLVELVLQMRGEEQQSNVTAALVAAGYEVREMS